MKENKILVFITLLLFAQISFRAHLLSEDSAHEFLLNGIDGPYIFNTGDSVLVYEINKDNELTSYKAHRSDIFEIIVPNETNDTFFLTLQDSLKKYPTEYSMAERIFAVSDIEGNFNALVSLLQGNGIMDEEFNWMYGNGHLVVNGDMVDRGAFVTPVLWLLYKLESQALSQGGIVHIILGNHEVMDIKGRTDYAQNKYIAAAQKISHKNDPSEALRYLFSENSELGAWLRTKNSIEKIGNIIFVHAGLSPQLLEYDYSLRQINDSIRAYLGYQTGDIENEDAQFLFRSFGPLWFRCMVMDYKDYYTKLTEGEVDSILSHYNASNIVISHTIVDSVSADYDGKVIRIDVHQPTEKNTGNAQALLIEDNTFYRISDLGKKNKLK